jgi:hypothetical protein
MLLVGEGRRRGEGGGGVLRKAEEDGYGSHLSRFMLSFHGLMETEHMMRKTRSVSEKDREYYI